MNLRVYEIIIVETVLILTVIFLLLCLVTIRRNIFLYKKMSKYTIKPLKTQNLSFFDSVYLNIQKLIHSYSKHVEKYGFFNSYAKKYEKYLSYEMSTKLSGMDLVASKFIIGYSVTFLYIVSRFFQLNKNINLLNILFSFLIGFFILDITLLIGEINKKKKIDEDLIKAIIILSNAFKSGKSTMQAISMVKNELDGPIGDEFKKIDLDISYGLDIETVFKRFYERVKTEDAKFISSSLSLMNKTGGNVIKVFDSIEKEIYNKKKLSDELKSLTSSSIFVFRFLLFMPIIVYLIIYIMSPTYFNVFFTTSIGRMIMIIILLFYIMYIFIVKRILVINNEK